MLGTLAVQAGAGGPGWSSLLPHVFEDLDQLVLIYPEYRDNIRGTPVTRCHMMAGDCGCCIVAFVVEHLKPFVGSNYSVDTCGLNTGKPEPSLGG